MHTFYSFTCVHVYIYIDLSHQHYKLQLLKDAQKLYQPKVRNGRGQITRAMIRQMKEQLCMGTSCFEDTEDDDVMRFSFLGTFPWLERPGLSGLCFSVFVCVHPIYN